MNHRIPLVATVVGALLIGGATTGTTLALWHDETALGQAALGAGAMSIAAMAPGGGGSSLGTLALEQGKSSASSVIAVVTDTSLDAGKNLRQRSRTSSVRLTGVTGGLTLSHLRLTVAPKTGDCPTAVPTLSADGYTSDWLGTTQPAAPDQTIDACVVLAATSSAPVDSSGTLELDLRGHQLRPGGTTPVGWSTLPSTVSVAVNVTAPPAVVPATPQNLRCGLPSGPNANNTTAYGILWDPVSGVDGYEVVQDGAVVATPGAASYSVPRDDIANNSSSVFRVRAVKNGVASGLSNGVTIRRTANALTCAAGSS